VKLTKATMSRIAIPAGKSDLILFDDDLKGFGIRLRAGGKRVWIVQYRVGAKQRRETLGDVNKLDADQARKAARDLLAKVTLGGDPQADKVAARVKASVTLGAIVDTYLNSKKSNLRPKSFVETERYLRKSWQPLHGLPVHKIDRRTVAARLAEITARNGPIAATRARAALSGLCAWAVCEGVTETNPVIGTNKPAQPRSRDRVLSDTELAEIWAACRDDDYGRIVRLLILTAQRRDEVGAMARSELDPDGGTWRIPSERTKNRRTHTIALPALVWSIVEKVERRDGNDRLFGLGDNGFGGWSKAKAALDRRILEARKRAAQKAVQPVDSVKSIAPWTVHDIRRSVATHLGEKLGVLPHVVEALLNHVSGHKAGVAGVYNHARYESETRAALALWADYIRALIEGAERKILHIHRILA
jgi:integrase